MSIRIFYDNIKFRIQKAGEIKRFLEKVIREEKYIPGDLNFIFMNDDKLLEINRKFLGHDYFTDVISFNYSENKIINGEVYISIETISKNAKELNIKTAEEVSRIMIHGVLHLCGYDDKNENDRDIMFRKQEKLVSGLMKSE